MCVQYAVCSTQCAACSVQFVECSVSVQCDSALFSVQYVVCSVSVQCEKCNIECAVLQPPGVQGVTDEYLDWPPLRAKSSNRISGQRD